MKWTAGQLTAFLKDRQPEIAGIVAPDDADVALTEIEARVSPQLSLARDERSLDSLVNVEAVDLALKKFYPLFRGENPDRMKFDELLAWRNRYVEAQIDKTIRVHLFRSEDAGVLKAATFQAMWELRETFDRDKGPYVAWARGIARNLARSHRPFDKRNVSIETGSDRPADLPSLGPSPEDSAVAGLEVRRPEGPPSGAFAEVLRMVLEAEPRKAIAFLFNRYLRIKPAQTAAAIRDKTLPEALAEAARLLKESYPEIAGVETMFRPLAERIAGCTEKFGELNATGEPIERLISQWGDTMHHSLGSNTVQQGKQFLKFLCKLSAAVHEILCFLWIRLLFAPPVELRHRADRPLMQLVEEFEDRFARRELLSRDRVEQCTAHLRKRVPQDRSLNHFAGPDLYASIKRWCEHIDSLIAGSVAGEHMLGYAYIMGSLRRGKERIQ